MHNIVYTKCPTTVKYAISDKYYVCSSHVLHYYLLCELHFSLRYVLLPEMLQVYFSNMEKIIFCLTEDWYKENLISPPHFTFFVAWFWYNTPQLIRYDRISFERNIIPHIWDTEHSVSPFTIEQIFPCISIGLLTILYYTVVLNRDFLLNFLTIITIILLKYEWYKILLWKQKNCR